MTTNNEYNLIGLLIQEPIKIYDISNIIRPEDFTDSKAKAIFNYINYTDITIR